MSNPINYSHKMGREGQLFVCHTIFINCNYVEFDREGSVGSMHACRHWMISWKQCRKSKNILFWEALVPICHFSCYVYAIIYALTNHNNCEALSHFLKVIIHLVLAPTGAQGEGILCGRPSLYSNYENHNLALSRSSSSRADPFLGWEWHLNV